MLCVLCCVAALCVCCVVAAVVAVDVAVVAAVLAAALFAQDEIELLVKLLSARLSDGDQPAEYNPGPHPSDTLVMTHPGPHPSKRTQTLTTSNQQ